MISKVNNKHSFSNMRKRWMAKGIESSTSNNDLITLYKLCRSTVKNLSAFSKTGIFVDCGTWQGASALTMLAAIRSKKSDAKIITIDNYLSSNSYDIINKRIKSIDNENIIEVVCSDDVDVIKNLPNESVCLVFIDPCHKYDHVLRTLENLNNKIIPGGIICGDDYTPIELGVVRAVEEWREK